MAEKKTGVVSGVVQFTCSLWADPFRWQLVKSVGIFGLAVFIAREMAAAEAAPPLSLTS